MQASVYITTNFAGGYMETGLAAIGVFIWNLLKAIGKGVWSIAKHNSRRKN